MSSHHSDSLFFFFQAEDGIRDGHVTGVQTCALPICPPAEGRTPARRAVSGRAYPGGMEEDLFSLGGDAPVPRTLSDRNRDHRAPLAVRMRPRTLEEIVGQSSALEPGSPLRRLVATDEDR